MSKLWWENHNFHRCAWRWFLISLDMARRYFDVAFSDEIKRNDYAIWGLLKAKNAQMPRATCLCHRDARIVDASWNAPIFATLSKRRYHFSAAGRWNLKARGLLPFYKRKPSGGISQKPTEIYKAVIRPSANVRQYLKIYFGRATPRSNI